METCIHGAISLLARHPFPSILRSPLDFVHLFAIHFTRQRRFDSQPASDRVMQQLIKLDGKPRSLRLDNGCELTCSAFTVGETAVRRAVIAKIRAAAAPSAAWPPKSVRPVRNSRTRFARVACAWIPSWPARIRGVLAMLNRAATVPVAAVIFVHWSGDTR